MTPEDFRELAHEELVRAQMTVKLGELRELVKQIPNAESLAKDIKALQHRVAYWGN